MEGVSGGGRSEIWPEDVPRGFYGTGKNLAGNGSPASPSLSPSLFANEESAILWPAVTIVVMPAALG